MDFQPDTMIVWQWKFITINATLVFSWVVIILLAGIAWLATRKLTTGPSPGKWQSGLEMTVLFVQDQIRDVMRQKPEPYLPFLGTLLLYISVSNFLGVVPGFRPPTGSLSTTAALALMVFFAVPVYGIRSRGVGGYLKQYIRPTPLMLPFNLIGEFSRTLALAVRLFGNVMSGTLIAAILLTVVPLFVPVAMRLLDLLVGQIQAYIFTVLAMVYIGSAVSTTTEKKEEGAEQEEDETTAEKENEE